MKIVLYFCFIGFMLFSCVSTYHVKSISHIPLVFDTISAKVAGTYSAEAEMDFSFFGRVSSKYKKEFKQLQMSEYVSNDGVQTNFFTMLKNIKGKNKVVDPTYNLALFSLSEKYPNIDYWTNIKVDRVVKKRKSALLTYLTVIPNFYGNFPNIITLGLLDIPVHVKSPYFRVGKEKVKITATGIELINN